MNQQKNNTEEFSDIGSWIDRYSAVVCAVLFCVFWLYRSFVYSGDGDQIVRMVEAGYWMVHSELLSHGLFQLVYRVLHPFGWDGLGVVQLVSCAAGAVAVYVVLIFNKHFIRIDPLWALGLFFSSGFALYCNGHTEYYTQFLIFLLLYGYAGVGYFRGIFGARFVGLVFSAAAWFHLGILFALPSLLVLPLINQKKWGDYKGLAVGLVPLVLIHFFKQYCSMFGFYIHGLSPSTNFVPLSPDMENPGWYTFFTLWHVLDWVYGWVMRSWIFWFVVWYGVWLAGWRSLLKPERMFLLLYTLCFTGFTIVWHPNLGIQQDWDLFAFEAAPCLLLVLSYMPVIVPHSFSRVLVAVPVMTSMLMMFHMIDQEAEFDLRGRGTVTLEMKQPPRNITFNGHNQTEDTAILRQGHYSVKILEQDGKKDFFVHMAPDSHLTISTETIPYTPVEFLEP